MLARLPASGPVVSCGPECPAGEVARRLAALSTHCAVISSSDNTVCGLVTTRDLAFRVLAQGLPGDTAVAAVMTQQPVSVPATSSPNEALTLMVARRVRHLPVVDKHGSVTGVLDITSCFYEAMLKMERMASQVEDLQCTVRDLREEDEHQPKKGERNEHLQTVESMEFSHYSMIDRAEMSSSLSRSPAVSLDDKLHCHKQKIVNDIKSLIDTLKQPDLESLLSLYKQPLYVEQKTDTYQAARLMCQHNCTAVLIVNEPQQDPSAECDVENVVGILTTKDLAFRVLAQGLDPAQTKVARVMTSKPVFAFDSMGIHAALRLMYEGKYLNLPIARNGKVVGIVNVLHLTREMLRTLEMIYVKSNALDAKDKHPAVISRIDSFSENDGPAWDKFWGSLEEPLRKSSMTFSRRTSSSTGFDLRLPLPDSNENLLPPVLTMKLLLKELDNPPILGVDGKIFKFTLTIDNFSSDFNVYSLIIDKLQRRLPIMKSNSLICDLGYFDEIGDFISIQRYEDLQLALNGERGLTLICQIRLNKSSATSAALEDGFLASESTNIHTGGVGPDTGIDMETLGATLVIAVGLFSLAILKYLGSTSAGQR